MQFELEQSLNPYADRTIDTLSDSDETLTINYNKSANFEISSKTKLQAGELNPMAYAGAKLQKGIMAVDADILYRNCKCYLRLR